MAKIGLRRPMFAPITTEGERQMPVYGAVIENNRAISAKLTWNRNDSALYADDIKAETDNAITGGDIVFGLDDVSKELQTAVLGVVEVGTGDDAYLDDVDAASPAGGFAYISVRKRRDEISYEGNFIYKVVFGQSNEETKTRGENIEWQTPELDGSISGVYIDTSGVARFRRRKSFESELGAVTWLKAIFTGQGTGG